MTDEPDASEEAHDPSAAQAQLSASEDRVKENEQIVEQEERAGTK